MVLSGHLPRALALFAATFAALLTASTALAQSPVLRFENLDGAPFPDRLVMSRIGTLAAPPAANGVHDVARVRLRHEGAAALTVSALTLAGPFELVAPPALPFSVPAGGAADLAVRLVAETGTLNNGTRGTHSGALTVGSNDPARPSAAVTLRGYWQSVSENNKEPSLVQLVEQLFGYKTKVLLSGQSINNRGRVERVGDEVLSSYWRAADPAQPVTVRQIAAFHGCCTTGDPIYWFVRGSSSANLIFRHRPADGQTVLPRINMSTTDLAAGSFAPSPGAIFGFRVSGAEWSDPYRNDPAPDDCSSGAGTCGHHVRFWPAKDAAGAVVPNAYLMGMDFAGINYDFNDNVYLVSNVTPADPVAATVPARLNAGGPAVTTGGVAYESSRFTTNGQGYTPTCDLGDIAGTTDDDLYRTELEPVTGSAPKAFALNVPVPNGEYTVRLHFAEIYWGSCGAPAATVGRRVFSVTMEGQRVLTDLDIFAEAGVRAALVKTFQTTVTGNVLNVSFLASVDNPMLSAIEVISGTANQPPVASFTATASPSNPLAFTFDGSGSTDSDGTIASYAWAFGDGTTGTGATTAHTYAAAGTYTATLTVTDDQGATGTASQSVTATAPTPPGSGPFLESGGLVVVEAEHAHESVARGGQSWTATPASGAVGTALGALPNTGANINAGFVDTSPELRFRAQFSTPGTYYVWGRVLAPSDNDDSFHAGIDGTGPASADRLVSTVRNGFSWANKTMDSNARATLTVGSAGEHVISVWMREDGLILDRLLLTTDASYTPTGTGPAESPRSSGNAPPIAEAGSVTVSQASGSAWNTVLLQRSFSDPIVIMAPPSYSDPAPLTIRVRNVTGTGFEFQLDEWDYLDGVHGTETVPYLVVERGVHTLAGGQLLEAGTAVANGGFQMVSLSAPFAAAPVVLTQVVTATAPQAATVRLRNVGTTSFQARLQAQESIPGFGQETLAYVAVTPGGTAGELEVNRTTNRVTNTAGAISFGAPFATAPVVVATMQTTNGADPSALRALSLSPSGIEVRVEEEQSADAETSHGAEVVGYAALKAGPIYAAPPSPLVAEGPSGSLAAAALPEEYVLEPNRPNPFRSRTILRYALPEDAAVRLTVFDALGRRVAVLVDEAQPAGWHEASFDPAGLATGVYVCRLEAGPFARSMRMALVR